MNRSKHQSNVIEWLETVNMLIVAELVILAALQRKESRGSHSRLDYPDLDETLMSRHYALQPVFEGIMKDAIRQGAEPENGYNAVNGDSGFNRKQKREEVIFNG